jgi:hypothetical protein
MANAEREPGGHAPGVRNMAPRDDEEKVTIAPDKARQGRRGTPVLWVLIAGLVLVMIVWGLVEIYGSYISPPPNEQVGDPATTGRPNVVDGNVPAGQ